MYYDRDRQERRAGYNYVRGGVGGCLFLIVDTIIVICLLIGVINWIG